MSGAKIKWEELDSKIGTIAERQLAKVIGCSIYAVHARRIDLKLVPHDDTIWEGEPRYL